MDAAGGLAAALGARKGIKILEVGLCAGGRISINLYVLAFRLGKRSARVAPRSSKEGGQGRSSRLSRISPNSFFLFTNLPYVKTKGCQTAHLPHSPKARNTNVTWQGWLRPFLLKPCGRVGEQLGRRRSCDDAGDSFTTVPSGVQDDPQRSPSRTQHWLGDDVYPRRARC